MNGWRQSDVATTAKVEEAERGDKNDDLHSRENLEDDVVYDGRLKIQTLPFEHWEFPWPQLFANHLL